MVEFKRDKELDLQINKLRKYSNISSAVRITLALLDVVFMILLISVGDYLLYGILAGVFFVLFISVMILTNKFYKECDRLKRKKDVYESHTRRRQGAYQSFTDTGFDLLDKEDYKLADLDIFGRNSIYQYLSVAKTKYGRNNLADRLKKGTSNKHANSVYERAGAEDLIDIESDIASFGPNAKNLDYEALLSTVGTKIKITTPMLLPVLSLICLIAYIPFIFTLKWNPYVPLVFIFLNMFLCKAFIKNDVFSLDSTAYYDLFDSYSLLNETLNKTEFKDNYLNELKAEITKREVLLKNAKSVFNLLSIRKNFAINLILNIFVFDFITVLIYNHRAKNLNELRAMFEAEGELEALTSLAIIGFDNSYSTVPGEIATGIDAIDMYHPLVKECVPNSIKFEGGIILTGSNMSGKTTFMRVLGLCQLLYNAGGIIPAAQYNSSDIEVLTSLRANDMLAEGVSTFYAEILRMKRINQSIKNGKCLILVDEIFKGTNTNDRIYASREVISNLNKNNALFIISTHDFELCDTDSITNYHFNEEYLDDKISFDYKIKEGKCTTKNAIYLLKMADII